MSQSETDKQRILMELKRAQLREQAQARAKRRAAKQAVEKTRPRMPTPRPRRVSPAKQGKPAARPAKPPTASRPSRPPAASRPSAPPARSSRPVPVSPELQAKIDELTERFTAIDEAAQLADVYAAVARLDDALLNHSLTLEALRARGYVHGGQLDDRLNALDDQWDDVRPRVESLLRANVGQLDQEVDAVERRVAALATAPSEAAVRSADMALNSAKTRIDKVEDNLSGLYSALESDLYRLEADLGRVEKMMTWLDEAPDIVLRETEGPIVAAKAEWQRDSEGNGPEGYLFLTDQRLIFEQREEVVTKRRFGIFKAESEMLQSVLLTLNANEIEQVMDEEEGRFRKKELLTVRGGPRAAVAEARFRLHQADSAEWATILRRVLSGEIDADRDEPYQAAAAEATELAAGFPENCPACMAAVPPVQRGVTEIVCAYCGQTITPEVTDG